MLRLAPYLKPYLLPLALMILFLVGQATANLFLPDHMAKIVNEGIIGNDRDVIISTGLRMLVVALLGGLCAVGVGFLASRIATGFVRDLRNDTFARVEDFSPLEFSRFSTASLITRCTNDMQQIQMALVLLLRLALFAPLMGIGAVIKAYHLAPSMAWIMAVAIGILLVVIVILLAMAMPRFSRLQILVDRLNLVTRERLTGMRVIRAFNREPWERDRFEEANVSLNDTNLTVNRMMAVLQPVMMLVFNLTSVAIVWVGAHKIDQNELLIGDMLAFMQYAMQAIMSFLMISMIFIMVPRAAVSARRVVEVLETEPSVLDPVQGASVPGKGGVVEFRDVSFSYPEAEVPVLEEITFSAQPGETTAIVGPTGSGKSTLIGLIERFYDSTEGSVLVNGVDVRQITLADLRGRIGYVPQKANLFSGTIESNIRYGKEDATMVEIAQAASTAQAMEFISRFDDGFQHPIAQSGANVSGGQRQRLSIARAVVREPEIYIFDDSFSALDFRTDAQLRAALAEETENRTVLIVAQRVNTIMHAEKIVVLDAGRVVGQGTHHELLESCSVYQEIAASQLSEEELAREMGGAALLERERAGMSSNRPSTSNAPMRPLLPIGPRGGPPGMAGPAEKAQNFKGTISRLIGYLKPFWLQIGLVIVFAIASTAFAIVSPRILGNVTNTIVEGYSQGRLYDQVTEQLPPGTEIPAGTTGAELLAEAPPGVLEGIPESQRSAIEEMDFSERHGIDFDGILEKVQLLVLLYAISAVFAYVQAWIMAGVSQQVTYDLRKGISEKIDRLPLSYFDARTHGEVLSRVTNDVETISQTLNQSLSQIVTSVTMLIGILVMMIWISWELTVVAILILPISFVLIRFITLRSQPYFIQQQASLGELNGHVEEMLSGHTVIKAYGAEEKSVATFRAINAKLYGSAWRAQFLSGLMMPIMMFVGNLGYVAVAVLGGWLAVSGTLRIGDIQAFMQYLNQFNQPIVQAATVANVLQSTAAAAERVFEFLDEAEESPDPANPIEIGEAVGAVEFDHLKFGYLPGQTIINDFSADVKPGQRVAIVGPTGAGKTTVVNLLMRFYDPDSGTIGIDGGSTEAMSRADVRRQFGMVLQDSWLFNGTIEENIAYGKEGATPAEVRAAAVAAHADHFIRSLPGGYQMELNEEADNISAGEKQLLTIARAMLADAPMLIFDEATSSVDTRTEASIQEAMSTLMQGRTSFVIAHRLSTIRNADLILVMKDGNILEQGTHDELMADRGFYADLYASQFTAPVVEEEVG